MMERKDVIKNLRELHDNAVRWRDGAKRKRVTNPTRDALFKRYDEFCEALKLALRSFGDDPSDLP